MIESIWRLISQKRRCYLCHQLLGISRGELSIYSVLTSQVPQIFHTKVTDPFNSYPLSTLGSMIEGFLHNINSVYYLVNPNYLWRNLDSIFDKNTTVSKTTMSILCLCIGLGCRSRASSTVDTSVMWYETGRKHLDDEGCGNELGTMQALALIGLYHIEETPTTAAQHLGK